MKSKLIGALVGMICILAATSVYAKNTVVVLETNMGKIEIVLYEKEAPLGTTNFLSYVDAGFYNGTIFHRVIPGFMIQGGGFDQNMNKKPTNPPIKNEATNGKKNLRGTLAYARMDDPHSATSQFFINIVHNEYLDHSDRHYGYAVFGKVIRGMKVVDAISTVKTDKVKYYKNVPVKPIIINKAYRKYKKRNK